MAHSAEYQDGSVISKLIRGDNNNELSKKFGQASLDSFMDGAVKVEQRIIAPNEVCPGCDSGLRFDLCCGKPGE